MAISDLPGQLELPQTQTDSQSNPNSIPKSIPNRLPVQLACDIGLFSDDASQIDLLELIKK